MRRLIGSLIMLISMAGGWLWMDYDHAIYDPLPIREIRYFEIAKGESVPQLSERLEQDGIIASSLWFNLAVRLHSVAGRFKAAAQRNNSGFSKAAAQRNNSGFLKAAGQRNYSGLLKYGEYEINPGITAAQLMELFASGKVRRHALTMVEGWTLRQYLDMLQKQSALQHDVLDAADLMKKLGRPDEQPEGRFYPDTYFFTKGTAESEILRLAYRKMQTTLATVWEKRAAGLPFTQPYEALILASIVEKETAVARERPLIAGVFIRRLQMNMRLQTDPTVIYGLGERFDGNIHRRDLENDTPFNTYTRSGLPPTPIANSGNDAIHAVLHPDLTGSHLYFVARGDGSHEFSSSLEAHLRAVDQYQLHPHQAHP
ncbi:MAG: endolytic transglycosylase MltG [Methylococcaceae bacterium]|nr:MAG: endolytic transglycosylase MltG [Methylococcaceae bacterium]